MTLKSQHKAELLASKNAQLSKENEFLRQQAITMQETIQLLIQRSTVDLRGAYFEGGFAESVRGNQVGSIRQNE